MAADRPSADEIAPYAAIVAEARAQVAAGRPPDAAALAARIRALAWPDRGAEQKALEQLDRVVAVHRARSLVTRDPTPADARPVQPTQPVQPARSLRSALRTKPTITGNLDVRRERQAEAYALAWDAVPAVVGWEVRLSERPDARSDYRELEARELPPTATSVDLPLADRPFRVNILGRARDGRLVRRALISGLTSDTWDERWQRRASAS